MKRQILIKERTYTRRTLLFDEIIRNLKTNSLRLKQTNYRSLFENEVNRIIL